MSGFLILNGLVNGIIVGVLYSLIGCSLNVLYGGLGTVTGPVLGVVIMVWVDDLIWQRFPLLNLFLLGTAIVLLIQFMPRGIVGSLMQRRPKLRRYIL